MRLQRRKFVIGQEVQMDMNDGTALKCVVVEISYPVIVVKIVDEKAFEHEFVPGDLVRLGMEVVN